MNPEPLHQEEQRIYYEHTDAAGVVYHADYLKFYERARTEWLRSLGLDHRAVGERHGIVFAVYKCEIAYLKPARLDDLLTVTVAAAAPRRTSMLFEQEIRRGETTVSTARITVVCVRDDGGVPHSTPIPDGIAKLLPRGEEKSAP